MVEIRVLSREEDEVKMRFRALQEEKLRPAMNRAAVRAASRAKTVGKSHVKKTYTVDNKSITRAVKITQMQDGAIFKVAGKRLSAGHYKAKKRKKGMFVSVKKGSGGIVPRSFAWSNTFWKRAEGVPREPFHKIMSPSVPQLFGNKEVLKEMAKEAMKKYEERLRHEVGRIMGG